MKKSTIIILMVTALVITSCNALSNIGIGQEPVEEELALQEIVAEPTAAVLADGGNYYRDEMDAEDPNKNWGLKVVTGLDSQLIWSKLGGKLRLETLPPNDVNYLFVNKDNRYENVIVEAEVENMGPLDGSFSLACRVNQDGWYEFRISPSGYYEFLRFDQYLRDGGKNAYVSLTDKRVNSTLINGGLGKNTFSLSCVDDLITVFINGEQLYYKRRPLAIEDDTYSDGAIGFGITGYGKEYDMAFNWVEAKRP
jgi:hypothetical protein